MHFVAGGASPSPTCNSAFCTLSVILSGGLARSRTRRAMRSIGISYLSAEIPPSVLLRSSIPLRFTQNDTAETLHFSAGGVSLSPTCNSAFCTLSVILSGGLARSRTRRAMRSIGISYLSAEIPPSVLLRSSIPLRFTQNDTAATLHFSAGGASPSPTALVYQA